MHAKSDDNISANLRHLAFVVLWGRLAVCLDDLVELLLFDVFPTIQSDASRHLRQRLHIDCLRHDVRRVLVLRSRAICVNAVLDGLSQKYNLMFMCLHLPKTCSIAPVPAALGSSVLF